MIPCQQTFSNIYVIGVPHPRKTLNTNNLDSKITFLETELKRVNDQMYRLKDDLIPVFKLARDKVPNPPFPFPFFPEKRESLTRAM